MVILEKVPRDSEDSQEYIDVCQVEIERLRDDASSTLRIAVATGIVTAGAILAAQLTSTSALIVAAVFSGVVFIMSVIDIIIDMFDIRIAKKNIAVCEEAL